MPQKEPVRLVGEVSLWKNVSRIDGGLRRALIFLCMPACQEREQKRERKTPYSQNTDIVNGFPLTTFHASQCVCSLFEQYLSSLPLSISSGSWSEPATYVPIRLPQRPNDEHQAELW